MPNTIKYLKNASEELTHLIEDSHVPFFLREEIEEENIDCDYCNGSGGWHGDVVNRDGYIERGVGEWEKCICQN